MAINFFGAIGITGGASGDLDDINHTNVNDGDIALVVDATANELRVYTYESSNATAEDGSPLYAVVKPDSNSGNGRWAICTAPTSTVALIQDFMAATTLTGALAGLGLTYDEMWLPAKAWTPHTTGGCAVVADIEFTTSDDVMVSYLAFDSGATEETAGINIVMPPSWDRSTIMAKFIWMGASGCSDTDTVGWGLQGISASNDDNLDTTEFTDTGEVILDAVTATTSDGVHITDKTPAITINGSPALGDIINLKVFRDTSADNMTEDALLIGVLIQYKITNTVAVW